MAAKQIKRFDEQEHLEYLVAMLNDNSGASPEKSYGPQDVLKLRRLVTALHEKYPDLRKTIDWRSVPFLPDDGRDLDAFADNIQVHIGPNGRAEIRDYYGSKHGVTDVAAKQFFRLLESSRRSYLGGPCGWRGCKQWFIKKKRNSHAAREFCPDTNHADNEYRAQLREDEHNRIVSAVKKAIARFDALSERSRSKIKDWRDYVAREAEVSRKQLTQLLLNGEVTPPTNAVPTERK